MTEAPLSGWSTSPSVTFRCFAGECVAFDARTGATHLLAGVAADIVRHLSGLEATGAVAGESTAPDAAAPLEQFESALRELQGLQVIRRAANPTR